MNGAMDGLGSVVAPLSRDCCEAVIHNLHPNTRKLAFMYVLGDLLR